MIKIIKKTVPILLITAFLITGTMKFPKITMKILSKTIYYSVYFTIPSFRVSTESETSKTIAEKVSKKSKKETTKVEDSLSDITNLEKKAMQQQDDSRKKADISEQDLHQSGATDSFENIFVKNVNDTELDIQSSLLKKADLKAEKKKPCVLLIHTHTTETYQLIDTGSYYVDDPSRSEDSKRNMIRIGDAVESQIKKAGYEVIHDETVYDNPYNGAYYRSEDATREWLKKYPSIQIVLDIHRDAIGQQGSTKVSPTLCRENGDKLAQIMIISGCQEEGNGITDFPDWKENLIFALQLQKELENECEGITRPLYFCPRVYNMNLTHCSLLVEIGSDTNTLRQAVGAGTVLGKAVVSMLRQYT